MAEPMKTHLKDFIKTANEEFMKRFKEAQFNQLAELYTTDGTVLPPNMEIIKGREAIAGLWQAVYNMGIKSVRIESVEMEDCGHLALEVGLFELYGTDRLLLDKGKYLVVWKREDGMWKLHRDIFNSSLPVQK